MKKFVPIIITVFYTSALMCGCSNNDKQQPTTTQTSTVQTTAADNSEFVPLEEVSTTASAKKYDYHSENLHASFTIPKEWLNKYAIVDDISDKGVKFIQFYEKENYYSNGKGLLFTFKLYPVDKYVEKKDDVQYGTVMDSDEVTYYVLRSVPSTNQYDTKSKGLTKSYKALSKKKYFNSICDSVVFDGGIFFDENGFNTEPTTTEPPTSESVTDTTDFSWNKTYSTTEPNVSGGLVFDDISTRRLTNAEVSALSAEQVQQAINDICAIHGYNFTTPSIAEHYRSFSWYSPSENFSESSFNAVEKYNYELLQKYRH